MLEITKDRSISASQVRNHMSVTIHYFIPFEEREKRRPHWLAKKAIECNYVCG